MQGWSTDRLQTAVGDKRCAIALVSGADIHNPRAAPCRKVGGLLRLDNEAIGAQISGERIAQIRSWRHAGGIDYQRMRLLRHGTGISPITAQGILREILVAIQIRVP